MKKQIIISLWLLLNLVGAYLSLRIHMPSVLPTLMIGANLLVVAASYLFGWMGAGVVASLFYSTMWWIGTEAFERWGYTKWVAYPMYGVLVIVSLILLTFRRRFIRNEPVPFVRRLIRPKQIKSVLFVLGDEQIDLEK